jgi:quinol monooxygenase YgiN
LFNSSVWESYDHHKKLINSPDYAAITDALKPAVGGKLDRDHIEASDDPSNALGAPCAEIAIFTLKEGQSKETFKERFARLVSAVNAGATPFTPCFWGESIETPGRFLLVIGWESRQVRFHIKHHSSAFFIHCSGPY